MPEPHAPSLPDRYPDALRDAEQVAIGQRRNVNGASPSGPAVGVALSGGGIRSATFCLGLFQSLARHGLVRRIDYLSTVSGGGYLGSFLGAAFSRDDGTPDSVEAELKNSHSWAVNWLRENGRFLSPNGAGDNWQAAAVALRNWVSLQIVLLTFCFLLFALGALIRADLCTWHFTAGVWCRVEQFFWRHPATSIWWSPWTVLPALPFVLLMVPAGAVYWLTQCTPLMAATRRFFGIFGTGYRVITDAEFASRSQLALTRCFTLGVIGTVALLGFSVIDSLGQTAYLRWAEHQFAFPTEWMTFTGGSAVTLGLARSFVLYIERFLKSRKFRVPSNVIALVFGLAWLLLVFLALSVVACGFAWKWDAVGAAGQFRPMSGGWGLMVAVVACFVASWIFSRSFGFVNLSSMQQMYAARLSRAYLGATNPARQRSANFDMTDLIPGDDIALDDYAPHEHGGPLHLINVTVNETLSGKTQIERRDRKGVAMAVGPCGMSVGTDSHAVWETGTASPSAMGRLQALWDSRVRGIRPVGEAKNEYHALRDRTATEPQKIEALPLGRWVAISGAAFTTGTGANTSLGLSLLLGLANVRLGYWWDSGVRPSHHGGGTRPNALELASRLLSRLMPVQTCLVQEFFARFHGPARKFWYLSDGGHFENTACYELIRRRVPFIVCSDAGQDPTYEFADLANLVRKARTDFGAEIQIVRRAADLVTDDPGVRFPMPTLEQLVHPSLLDVIGTPEDFVPLQESAKEGMRPRPARRHAMLARIHYFDTHEFAWLLLIKPSLMGDESADVVQYQQTHPLFPQEPTSDQYFDEAQWESYRKLGEHIGTELFTAPLSPPEDGLPTWSPNLLRPPVPSVPAQPTAAPAKG